MGRLGILRVIAGLTYAMCVGHCLAAAPPPDSEKLDEVTVSAPRLYDRKALSDVIIPRFVKSHAVLSPKIQQIGRWAQPICPMTVGVLPAYADFVSHRVVRTAASVGAPYSVGPCQPNVEILFMADPQTEIDFLAKHSPVILGYNARSPKYVDRVNHAVQAWYVTGTRRPEGDWRLDSDEVLYIFNAGGGSRIRSDMSSEFGNVLVVVSQRDVTGMSFPALADYIAMLVLSRAQLDGCGELPSIVDLFSPDCGTRPPPTSLTDADLAYLRALYASNSELRAVLQRGDIRVQMLRLLTGGAYDKGGLPASVLNRYLGVYEFPSGTLVAIERDGLKLTARVAAQLPFEIVPKSQTEFSAKGMEARLRFVLDSHDESVALVMHREGTEATATRITDQQVQAEIQALQARIANQTPDAHAERALRELLDGLQTGKPNYSSMSPVLAAAIRGERLRLRRNTLALGTLSRVQFVGVDDEGADVFDVMYSSGKSVWRIRVGKDGLLRDAFIDAIDNDWAPSPRATAVSHSP